MAEWLLFSIMDFVWAVFTGLFTSLVFLLILSRYRPKISISPVISKGIGIKTSEPVYRIKVINRSNVPITDIKAQLHIFENYQTATGEIWKSSAIKLTRSDPISIDGYDLKDCDANYAYRFLTNEDIEGKWNDDTRQFLRFRIFARHSTSGFGGFFTVDYRLKRRSIVDGDFSKGDTFEIV